MTMDAGADVQQGSETAVSETDAQQIATLAQVRRMLYPYHAVGILDLEIMCANTYVSFSFFLTFSSEICARVFNSILTQHHGFDLDSLVQLDQQNGNFIV